MKFNDLKLFQKLTLGFGILIAAIAAIGILAITNMLSVSKQAGYLSEEYIPEVKIANSMERNALLAMFNNRGYSFSEETSYLDEGRRYFSNMTDELQEAKNLAANTTQLKALNHVIADTENAADTYKNLLNQTVEVNENLAALRNLMDQESDILMRNCSDYLTSQENSYAGEIRNGASTRALSERMNKVIIINDIIDQVNELRVNNFKAQAKRKLKAYKAAINKFDINKELSGLRGTTRLDADKRALEEIENAANDYVAAMENFLNAWQKRESLNTERNIAANMVLSSVEKVTDAGISATQTIANNAHDDLKNSSNVVIVGLIAALLIGIILAYSLTKALVIPIQKGVAFAKQVASGNLLATIDVNQKDEIGDLAKALVAMVDTLKSIVGNIVTGANNIAAASNEMSTTSQSLSQGSNEQAASAEEVSSSMEEMSATIQQNTDNAIETEQIAIKAADGVGQGNNASIQSVSAMKEVASKITIINDIAFQTNILALNAAVEAARAGEHGRGFAVVAAEVRKLAERSAVAAKEIDEVSKSGVSISESAGKLLSETVPEIEKTSRLVKEIAASSVEQSSNSSQVNSAIQQLNRVTQQNAAAAEEMATSSEELSAQAEKLKEIIGFFSLGQDYAVEAYASKSNSRQVKQNYTPHEGVDLKLEIEDDLDDGFTKF